MDGWIHKIYLMAGPMYEFVTWFLQFDGFNGGILVESIGGQLHSV